MNILRIADYIIVVVLTTMDPDPLLPAEHHVNVEEVPNIFVRRQDFNTMRQYRTPSGVNFAPDIHIAMTFIIFGRQHCLVGIRHKDPGFPAFTTPLVEITEIHDVIKVFMTRVRPQDPSMVTASDIECGYRECRC